jgi:hypothetical protein
VSFSFFRDLLTTQRPEGCWNIEHSRARINCESGQDPLTRAAVEVSHIECTIIRQKFEELINSLPMPTPEPRSTNPGPPRVSRDDVIAKCDYFTRVHLWPLKKALDPESWLQNFRPDELDHSVHLLNSFMYFHQNLVQEMFAASIQALSRRVTRSGDSFITALSTWSLFFNNAIIVPVAGEHENPSDSGYSFARMARQHLGFREEQIMSPANALSELANGPRPVIFVDDFVGTGNQFTSTWFREFETASGTKTSFSIVAGVRGMRFFYCPVLCTVAGLKEIELQCPTVVLSPAHVITERYSALSPDSLIWPAHLKSTGVDFLQRVSQRAGIPDTDGGSPDDWRGYEKRGLVLAIHETIPDSTLCLLRWNKNG